MLLALQRIICVNFFFNFVLFVLHSAAVAVKQQQLSVPKTERKYNTKKICGEKNKNVYARHDQSTLPRLHFFLVWSAPEKKVMPYYIDQSTSEKNLHSCLIETRRKWDEVWWLIWYENEAHGWQKRKKSYKRSAEHGI
jgi:hypothetical protein